VLESCQTNFTIFCSFYLFQYHKQTIEVNLVGGVIPLVVSLGLAVFLIFRRRKVIPVLNYSISVGLVYSLAWAASDVVTHQISAPGFVFIGVDVLFVGIWLRAYHSEINRDTIGSSYLQVYAIGTFGIFLSDVIRTISSFASVPYLGLDVTLLIIGGAGPSDAVFVAGIYFLLIFLIGLLVTSCMHKLHLGKKEFCLGNHTVKKCTGDGTLTARSIGT
jgi:hypothetical protein